MNKIYDVDLAFNDYADVVLVTKKLFSIKDAYGKNRCTLPELAKVGRMFIVSFKTNLSFDEVSVIWEVKSFKECELFIWRDMLKYPSWSNYLVELTIDDHIDMEAFSFDLKSYLNKDNGTTSDILYQYQDSDDTTTTNTIFGIVVQDHKKIGVVNPIKKITDLANKLKVSFNVNKCYCTYHPGLIYSPETA